MFYSISNLFCFVSKFISKITSLYLAAVSLAVSKQREVKEDTEINNNDYHNDDDDNADEILLKEEPIDDSVDLNELEEKRNLNMFNTHQFLSIPHNTLSNISGEPIFYRNFDSKLVMSSVALPGHATLFIQNNASNVGMISTQEPSINMHGTIGSNLVMDDQSLAAAEALTQLSELPRYNY